MRKLIRFKKSIRVVIEVPLPSTNLCNGPARLRDEAEAMETAMHLAEKLRAVDDPFFSDAHFKENQGGVRVVSSSYEGCPFCAMPPTGEGELFCCEAQVGKADGR